MNIITKLNIALVLIVLLSFSVSAFGVSSSWWRGNPLVLEPGESRDVSFTLQNGGGAKEDVIAKVELTGDAPKLAEIIDDNSEYLVPVGAKVNVNVRIRVPSNANIGDEYIIGISAKTKTEAGGGGVFMASGAGISFPLLIQPHEPIPETTGEAVRGIKEQNNIFLIAGLLLIIAIVIFIFYELHNKKSGTEKNKGKKRG